MHTKAVFVENESLKPPSDETQWVDVSNFFTEAAKELKLGEMIHDDDFNLYEVMSAIEIMDPKMDTQCNSTRVLSVHERIESGQL